MHIRINNKLYNFPEKPSEYHEAKIVDGSATWVLNEELKLKKIRAKRNQLLNESDYMAMPDYPLTEIQRVGLNAYRQALRDLPNSITDINNVVFPVLEL